MRSALDFRRTWPWLVAVAIGGYALYVGLFSASLTLKATAAADFLRLLGTLGIAALLVERTIEVFMGARRGKVTERLFSAAESAKLALISAPANVTMHETVVAREGELIDYRAETKKRALRAAVVLGLLVAAAGFRTLENLVVAPATGMGVLFRLLDVVMTAAVIGGGSEAIHRMISTVTTYLDATSVAVRDRELVATVPARVVAVGIPQVTPGPPPR